MNWLKLALTLISLAPSVVQGVETIGRGRSGSDKHQMAKQALMLASGVAATVDPKDADTINTVSGFASNVIDNTVAAFNASGVFTKQAPLPLTTVAQ